MIEIDGYVTQAAVDQVRQVLRNKNQRDAMVARNYRIARQYFSYSVLRRRLKNLIQDSACCQREDGKSPC